MHLILLLIFSQMVLEVKGVVSSQKGKKPTFRTKEKKDGKRPYVIGFKKNSFKGTCNYCKRVRHVKVVCFKHKNILEKEGNSLSFSPLALFCFESNAFEWLNSGAIVHVSNVLQDLKSVRKPS